MNITDSLSMLTEMPWFNSHYEHFASQLAAQNLSHASLLTSAEGQGEEAYLVSLAQLLLCDNGNSCGTCRNCELFKYGHHPDLMIVEPLPPSLTIRIAQIRELTDFMTLLPHSAKHKVVIIYQADRLNKESSNALLKTLEEPPSQCYLLLSSSFPKTLLPTIRSRTLTEMLPAPTADETLAFLRENFSRQGQAIAEDQLLYAVKRFPQAPIKAMNYVADKGIQIEKQLLRWLYQQWIEGSVQVFPVFPQLAERYPDRTKRQRVELSYLLQVVSTLTTYQARPALANQVKHSDTTHLINSIPMNVMQSYHRSLLQAIPRLSQLTVGQHIAAITQTARGAL